nr:uncharacterized protein LOC120966681 isoform X3 [Aegilops tauschii subsp. strangulata]
MPDDILIEILSLMTISEAAMTGFLSTRWRHVWKKIDHLILDSYAFGMQELEKSRNHENPLLWNDVATKFVNKVNGLLHSRYASTEKLFLDLDNKCCKEGCMICAKGVNAASEPYEFLLGHFFMVYRVLQHATRFAGLTTVILILMKPWKEDISSVAYLLKSAALIEYFGLHGCCKLQQHTQLNIPWPEDFILSRLYTIIIGGFSGEFELMELVYFLLRSTPALDVFRIDTRAMEPWLVRANEDKLQDDTRRHYARDMAYAHLVPKVPSTAKFHII